MNKYVFKVRLCDGYECDGRITITAKDEDIAQDIALDYVCKKLADALPELGIDISVELDEEIMCEEYEKELIEKINGAKKHCKGELELDLFTNDTYGYGWYAMDYREDLEAAVEINNKEYDKPLILAETAYRHDVDVRRCCDVCGVYYVG